MNTRFQKTLLYCTGAHASVPGGVGMSAGLIGLCPLATVRR